MDFEKQLHKKAAPLSLPAIKQQIPLIDKKSIAVLKTLRHQLIYDKLKIHYKKEYANDALFVIFLIDSSSSMTGQVAGLKGVINKTILKYQLKPAHFALVALVNGDALLVSALSRNSTHLLDTISQLRTGGKTNMARGFDIIKDILKQQPLKSCRIYIFTDGKINAGNTTDPFQETVETYKQHLRKKEIKITIVDTEQEFIKLYKAKQLAQAITAKYIRL